MSSQSVYFTSDDGLGQLYRDVKELQTLMKTVKQDVANLNIQLSMFELMMNTKINELDSKIKYMLPIQTEDVELNL